MEVSNSQLIKEEKNILSSKLINIKQTIYKAIFGNDTIKSPIDALIFGYFIGFFSELEDKPFEEEKIRELYSTFQMAQKNSNYENIISKCTEYLPKKLLNIPCDNEEKNIIDINNYEEEKIELEGEEYEHGKCEICLKKYNILSKTNYFLECGCIVHFDCFNNYIINCLEQGLPFYEIICPLCQKIIIKPNIIITSLKNSKREDIIEKNETLSEIAYPDRKKIEEPKKIYCLNTKCNFNFILDQEDDIVDKFKCPKCSKEFCIKCKDYWHQNLTCQEFQEKLKSINESIISFRDFAKNNKFVECPNCKTWLSEDENSPMCNLCTCICGTKIKL